MQDQIIFSARGYDKSSKKHQPYLIFSWFFGLGLLSFFVQLIGNDFNYKLALGWLMISIAIFFIESILYNYFIPSKLFKVIKDPDQVLWLSIDGENENRKKIKNVKYWWNYHFPAKNLIMGNTYPVGGRGDYDAKAKPPANQLNIYVSLEINNDENVILHQVLGNWATTPHWDYKLTDYTNLPIIYSTKKLRQLVDKITLLK